MILDQLFCFFFCAKVISHQVYITENHNSDTQTQRIVQEITKGDTDEQLSKSPQKGGNVTTNSKESSVGSDEGTDQKGLDGTNWANKQKNVWKANNPISGYVSTYTATYGGCLGCTKYYDEKGQLYYKMANGEKLDDNRLTIAFYNLGIMPLGTRVSLVNRTNGKSIVATVTDTGGFMDCCGRIADLSLATANAIGARTDKDIVEISEVPKVAEK